MNNTGSPHLAMREYDATKRRHMKQKIRTGARPWGFGVEDDAVSIDIPMQNELCACNCQKNSCLRVFAGRRGTGKEMGPGDGRRQTGTVVGRVKFLLLFYYLVGGYRLLCTRTVTSSL